METPGAVVREAEIRRRAVLVALRGLEVLAQTASPPAPGVVASEAEIR
jgi:hypothetical protein